ncbi:MAG: Sec-independent protein translocase subunit TatA/TatB [Solirubrobacteraceae bacterium]
MVGDILQPTHLIFILIVALLVLGPKRLPEVGRQLGSGLRDFRAALSGERVDRDEPTPTQSFQPSAATFAETHVESAAHVEPDYTTDPVLDDDAQALGPERFESAVPEHEHDSPDGPAESAPAESESATESVVSAPAEAATSADGHELSLEPSQPADPHP